MGVTWPYLFAAYDREHGMTRDNWHGSLLESARDKSGLQFRRNRYYDPQTGRFTQEDPIGLAGGLNLYGFAGGDPVNFGDPFGLCPDAEGKDDGKPCPLGDIKAAHNFWLNMAVEGHQQGGVGGALKVAAGIAASTLLDYTGATTVDESARTIADPDASTGDKLLAAGAGALVVSGNLLGVGGGNAVANGVRAGTLQEVGQLPKLLGAGNAAYRGSRLYGLRNAAGATRFTDKHGFYFAIDMAKHYLHLGSFTPF